MRVVGFLLKTILVLLVLAVGGLAAVWYFNPFAPAISMGDPLPTGRRVTLMTASSPITFREPVRGRGLASCFLAVRKVDCPPA
jgi:hypothetical protein